jgi:hypothetical protein
MWKLLAPGVGLVDFLTPAERTTDHGQATGKLYHSILGEGYSRNPDIYVFIIFTPIFNKYFIF